MAHAGLSIGTATGGGTILVDNIGGTLWPVNKIAVGGPGTATPVHAGAPLPVSGTVVAAGTQVVSGTVTAAPSGVQSVAGTVTAGGTQVVIGTVSIAGTVPVSGGGGGGGVAGTVAVSGGTVTALAAGTQLVSGTVVTSGGSGPGTVAISGGTVTAINVQGWGDGGEVITTHGLFLESTAVNLSSGTATIAAPDPGVAVAVYAALITAGTTGSFIFRSGTTPLTGTIHVDQYGGFAHAVTPPGALFWGAAGSALQLVVTSGTPNLGGVISFWAV